MHNSKKGETPAPFSVLFVKRKNLSKRRYLIVSTECSLFVIIENEHTTMTPRLIIPIIATKNESQHREVETLRSTQRFLPESHSCLRRSKSKPKFETQNTLSILSRHDIVFTTIVILEQTQHVASLEFLERVPKNDETDAPTNQYQVIKNYYSSLLIYSIPVWSHYFVGNNFGHGNEIVKDKIHSGYTLALSSS